jgi:hypothetical protein
MHRRKHATQKQHYHWENHNKQHVKQNKETQEICEVITGKSKSKESTQHSIYKYVLREVRLTPFIFLRHLI